MTEFQKVVIGLLEMSHPEISRVRSQFAAEATQSASRRRTLKPTPIGNAVSAVKFAIAALLTGSRAIPLGDNGRLTRELGEYGNQLKGC
jgi:hypothetical protein